MDYPCYVLHVKKGFEEREKSIVAQFEKLSLSFTWILDFDIPELGREVLEKYRYHGSQLRDAEISCCLKHIAAWEKIAAGSHDGGFVFEDDALIDCGKFEEIVMAAIAEFNSDRLEVGCLCLGDGCAMHVPWTKLKRGKRLYRAEQVRAADSYWLTRKAARLMLERLNNNGFFLPADHLITKIAAELHIPIFWVEPTVVCQGSHTGRFRSTIQNLERGTVKDSIGWFIKKIRRRYIYPLFGVDLRVIDKGLRASLKIEDKECDGGKL